MDYRPDHGVRLTSSTKTLQNLILHGSPREEMVARLASLSWRPNSECHYFGCIGRPGHYLFTKSGRDSQLEISLTRLFGGLDRSLCWNGRVKYDRDEREGRAFVTHKGGWTAVAFWDRSVDTRGACNSAFLVRGELTFEQAIRIARHQWPKIWARFAFEVVEVDALGRSISSPE